MNKAVAYGGVGIAFVLGLLGWGNLNSKIETLNNNWTSLQQDKGTASQNTEELNTLKSNFEGIEKQLAAAIEGSATGSDSETSELLVQLQDSIAELRTEIAESSKSLNQQIIDHAEAGHGASDKVSELEGQLESLALAQQSFATEQENALSAAIDGLANQSNAGAAELVTQLENTVSALYAEAAEALAILNQRIVDQTDAARIASDRINKLEEQLAAATGGLPNQSDSGSVESLAQLENTVSALYAEAAEALTILNQRVLDHTGEDHSGADRVAQLEEQLESLAAAQQTLATDQDNKLAAAIDGLSSETSSGAAESLIQIENTISGLRNEVAESLQILDQRIIDHTDAGHGVSDRVSQLEGQLESIGVAQQSLTTDYDQKLAAAIEGLSNETNAGAAESLAQLENTISGLRTEIAESLKVINQRIINHTDAGHSTPDKVVELAEQVESVSLAQQSLATEYDNKLASAIDGLSKKTNSEAGEALAQLQDSISGLRTEVAESSKILNQQFIDHTVTGHSTTVDNAGILSGLKFASEYKVYFDHDNYFLNPTEKEKIVDSIESVDENTRILLIGHSDTTGSNVYNLNLSAKRAVTVRNSLIDSLVKEGKYENQLISIEYLGEESGLVPTADEVDNASNRVVEVRFFQ